MKCISTNISDLRDITENAILKKNIEKKKRIKNEKLKHRELIDSTLKSIFQRMEEAAKDGLYEITDGSELIDDNCQCGYDSDILEDNKICSDVISDMIFDILSKEGYKIEHEYGHIKSISWDPEKYLLKKKNLIVLNK